MNMSWRHLAAPIGIALLAASVGCTSQSARGYCEAHAECERDFLGINIPDQAGNEPDSVAVCAAIQTGNLNSLRANEEEECQEYAELLEIYMACIGSEFADNGDGCDAIEDECKDELDDVNDALVRIDGDECTANED